MARATVVLYISADKAVVQIEGVFAQRDDATKWVVEHVNPPWEWEAAWFDVFEVFKNADGEYRIESMELRRQPEIQ